MAKQVTGPIQVFVIGFDDLRVQRQDPRRAQEGA